ncbi:MAG: autotransporter domain-containing protein [Planctomycetaceae bacterium]|jgi:uncharacterized protein with beta-barrel porin domain|nr:autotransporter domain-containing protein [Planctomycetaceae bacterium]
MKKATGLPTTQSNVSAGRGNTQIINQTQALCRTSLTISPLPFVIVLTLLLFCAQNVFGQAVPYDEYRGNNAGANGGGYYRSNSYGTNAQRTNPNDGSATAYNPVWGDTRALPTSPIGAAALRWHGDFSGTLSQDARTGTLEIVHSLATDSNNVNADGSMTGGTIRGLAILEVEKDITGGTLTNIGLINVSGAITGGGFSYIDQLTATGGISGGTFNNVKTIVAGFTGGTISSDNGANGAGVVSVTGDIGGSTVINVYGINIAGSVTTTGAITAGLGGLVISQDFVNNTSGVTVNNNGSLTVSGSITNNTGKTITLNGSGSLTANGSIANDGTITIGSGNLTANGNITNTGNGSISNSGNSGTLTTGGSLTNSGTINFYNIHAYTLVNNTGGSITARNNLAVDGSLTNDGTITGSGNGTLSVSGLLTNNSNISFYNISAGTLINNTGGSITARNNLAVSGKLTNDGTITVNQSLTVSTDLENNGILLGGNSARITGETLNTGTIQNWGTFRSGSITNTRDGKIYDVSELLTDGDLNNIGGEIDGIVSSSLGKHMEVGGNLNNTEHGTITDYSWIEVARNLLNDDATITGGHWYHRPSVPSGDFEMGYISVAGNVVNQNGAAIDTFDRFLVDGNVTNDASSITAGHLAHLAGGEMIPGNDAAAGWGETMFVVKGTLANAGAISIIDVISVHDLQNLSGGTIDDIYVLSAESINNFGTISNIGDHIGVSGGFTNETGGLVDAVEKVSVGGALKNDGTITHTKLLKVDGLLENGGIIGDDTNTDDHSSVSDIIAGGGLTNTGTINVSALKVTGDVSTSTHGSGGIYADTINIIDGTFTIGGTVEARSIYAAKTITIDADFGGSSGGSFGTMTTDADLIVNSGNRFTIAAGTSAQIGNIVTNDGTIIVNGTLTAAGTSTPAQQVTNNGVLTLGSSGVVNGNVINNGTSAYDTADLRGNGMIRGSVTNGEFGVLAPSGSTANAGIGSLVIKGDFYNDGGTLEIGIRNAVPLTDFPLTDFIRVTGGTAQINGGTLDVDWTGATLKKGVKYYFLDTDNSGNLQVTTALGANSTGTVMRAKPDHDDKSYWLEYTRFYDYGTGSITDGMTVNQFNTGTYLDIIGSEVTEGSRLWKFLEGLDADREANGDAGARYALDQLSGAIYGTLGTVSVHNTGIVNMTLADTLRSDVFKFSYIGNPNNAIRGQAIAPLRYSRWATAYGIGGQSKNDGNASGYKQSFGGGIAGFDRAFWTGSRVGAYISGADGTVTMKQLSETSRSREFLVGLYLRQEMYYGYGIASLGLGQDMYKTTRNITFLGETAANRHHGDVGTAYFERGVDLPWRYGAVSPYMSFQAAAVRQKDFTESGSLAGLSSVKGETSSFRLAFGTRTSTSPIPLPFGQIAFTGNLTWFHEFATDNDRDFSTRLSVAGEGGTPGAAAASFRVWGNDPKQDWINLGFGTHFDRNSSRIFVGGSLYANDRQVLYTGNGGFVTSW